MTDSKIARVNVSTTRTPAGRAYRATIEALLDKVNGEVLAELWREVCPYPVDELPQRHGMIEDLADFAEVLRPRLADMQANELCRLIQRYAVQCRRQPAAHQRTRVPSPERLGSREILSGGTQLPFSCIRIRAAARTTSVTRIETLPDKVDDAVLAKLWRQTRPLDVEHLPDRQGIIADLADFAEVLQPRLNGMQASQLCRLIEAYATKHRRSHRFVRSLLWGGNAGQSRVVARSVSTGLRQLRHEISVAP
jgi:hypothetical protein